ncbi:hypothetical protein BJ322DRAFT_1017263 [Thelephora terrestris]|uniref:F-box domain-containing protein n=1 Tax=Thelephora terrestris TaxID=56493 RepID=A0A9P6HNU3_9AGAM|nr:hypothetical protein BJ322DRAFT_1017263 [Thelephora terrestris]
MEQTSANGGALPAECWEEIILRLPPSKIPSIRLLNRRFCELIDGSPVIKYYLDLFSAGLEEGADTGSLSIQDRQQKLESYCSRWESFDRAERAAPLLLPDIDDAYVDKGFFICGEDAGGGKEDIHFMRLPSPAIGLTQKEWTIQAPPASTPYGRRRAIYPPLDLFAISVLSQEESSFQIEMFHMSDGTRYPNYGVMGFDYGPRQRINGIRLELTGRRISARVLTLTRLGRGAFERNVQDLFVWDWRTGEKRLERTQTRIMTARFIDEYRLIGTVRRSDKNVLILWDTSSDTTNDHMRPHGLILETKPRNVSGLTVPDYNMNHELPFRESHSSGVVAFTLRHPGFEATFVEMEARVVGVATPFDFDLESPDSPAHPRPSLTGPDRLWRHRFLDIASSRLLAPM